jgi:hypothetical protein
MSEMAEGKIEPLGGEKGPPMSKRDVECTNTTLVARGAVKKRKAMIDEEV